MTKIKQKVKKRFIKANIELKQINSRKKNQIKKETLNCKKIFLNNYHQAAVIVVEIYKITLRIVAVIVVKIYKITLKIVATA